MFSRCVGKLPSSGQILESTSQFLTNSVHFVSSLMRMVSSISKGRTFILQRTTGSAEIVIQGDGKGFKRITLPNTEETDCEESSSEAGWYMSLEGSE